MKVLFTFFALSLFSIANAQDKYLVINPDGHKSTIRAMAIDDENKIITAGSDKTVKVWDPKRGEIVKEFRGQIGPGTEGMIYAMALSPNQEYLAVGGWFGKDDESEPLGDIRVYNYKTGKLYKLLTRIHTNTIKALAFTNDSRFLIAGDADGNIVKWDFASRIPQIYDPVSYETVTSIAMGDDYFITTCGDGMIYKWGLEKTKPQKKIDFFNKPNKEYNISSFASISDDNEWVAVGGKESSMILIFNRKMSLKQYFFVENSDKIVDMNFSPSNTRLIVSTERNGKNKAVVYELFGKDWEKLTSYQQNALISKVDFIDENTCVSAGGYNNEIVVFSIKTDHAKVKRIMSGVGQTYYSASLNGAQLAYGLKADDAYGLASYSDVFNLFSRRKEKINTATGYNFPIQKKGSWSLSEFDYLRKTDWDPSYILKIKENEVLKAEIKRYPWDGNRHRSFSFVGDKYIVSGGDYGMLQAYDYNGNQVSQFVGHEDAISSVSISVDGKFLVSASYDNTIKLWPISEIGNSYKTGEIESMWQVCKDQGILSWRTKIKNVDCEALAKESSTESWQKVIFKLREKGYEPEFFEYYLNDVLANKIYPVVSIFVASNQEWVIWNNDGYFSSSKRGAQFIGYHINQGKKNAATFYPFEQFDLKYNRPDIIFMELGITDQSIIDLYHRAYLKRLKRSGLTDEELNSEIHIPTIEIKSSQKKENAIDIEILAKDTKYDLNKITIFNNDVPIFGVNGISLSRLNTKSFSKTYTVELMEGDNKIQFSVMNTAGAESFKETIYINSNDEQDKDLYVVSIGTSKYKDNRYDLKYAAKDAEDMSSLFEDNKLYSTVHNLLLTNERVTKDNIFKVKDFLANVSANDVVILFIAGHGVLNKDYDYYYCTHDVDFNKPEEKGISYTELEALFDGIKPIRKLLIMDTCHSGEVDKDEIEEIEAGSTEEGDIIFRSTSTALLRERKGLKQTNEIVKEMFNDLNRGTGTTVISSAGGVEFAMESDKWKNGLFTYCLLNGLTSKDADLNKDGTVFLSELQSYIRQEVRKKSNGKQVPTSRFENISLDYPIW